MSTRTPDSARVLQFLKASKKPQSVRQISEETYIPLSRVKSYIKSLVKFGRVKNATPGHIPTTYAAVVDSTPLEIPQVAGEGWRSEAGERFPLSNKVPKPEQVTQPRTKYMSVEPYRWTYTTPARPGATDHEDVPSRRTDGLHKHKPMILMASKVRHGEGGR